MLGLANAAKLILDAEDRTRGAFAAVERNLTGLKAKAGLTGEALGGLLGGAGGLGLLTTGALSGIALKVNQIATEIDGLGKAAQGAGVTTEALSELRYAAELGGLEARQMDEALAQLSEKLVAASEGGNEAARAFAAMQIDPRQFTSADQAIRALADRFSQMPDGVQKSAFAAQIFGDELGRRLVPLLNAGTESMDRAAEQAREFGLVVGEEAAVNASRFVDAMTRLNRQMTGLSQTMATPIIERFADFVEQFERMRAENGGGILGTLRAIEDASSSMNPLTDWDAAAASLTEELAAANAELDDMLRRREIDEAALGYEFWTGKVREAADEVVRLQSELQKVNRTALDGFPGFGVVGAPMQLGVNGVGGGGEDDEKARKAAEARRKAGEDLVKQLTREVYATQELSRAEKFRLDLALDSKDIPAAYREQAAALAELVDVYKEANEAAKAQAELDELVATSLERDRASMNDQAQAYRDMIDPMGAFLREAQRVQELRLGNMLTETEAVQIIDHLRMMADGTANIASETEKSRTLMEQMGATFVSEAERAIFAWEGFGDLLKSIAIDFARIQVRGLLNNLFEAGTGALFGGAPIDRSRDVTGGSLTVINNVAAGVSQGMVADAVRTGMSATETKIASSMQRGGMFA